MGRHTGIYAVGAFGVVGVSLINVAVVTRFLDPSQFGRLALLLFFAALLTVIYNLGSLQGTLMKVFGSTGEEEVEEEPTDEEIGNKRRLLGNGLVTTALVGALGTIAIALVASPTAELLLGDRGAAHLVVIAALSAALGAVWRLASNVLRMERRPAAYAILTIARPVLVIAAVVPLVATGGGIEGVLVGIVIGTALANLTALVVTRESYTLAFSRRDAIAILRRGVFFVPVILGFWVVQNVDLYLLSRFVSEEEVGYYRLATRFGVVVSYFTSAVTMAWAPLERSSAYTAADREQGGDRVRAMIVTYYVIASVGLILGMALAAHTLVRIAPPAYVTAAPLIPLVAGGYVAHGCLIAFYRASRFPRRRLLWVSTVVGLAIVFTAAALILIPWLGTTGAALSVIVGFGVGMLAIWSLSQSGPAPVPYPYWRIGGALLIGTGCLGVSLLLEPLAGGWTPALDAACFAAYPVLLVATGAIPRQHLRPLVQIARSTMPHRRPDLTVALRELDPSDRAALELVVRARRPISEAAQRLATSEPAARARLVGTLRRVSALGDGSEADADIGLYLFSQSSVAERDALARRLWSEGINPAEMHALESALEEVKRTPARAWSASGAAS